MSAVEDFIAERRWWPWLPLEYHDGAPAKELYETYRARMQSIDRPALSNNVFAKALQDAGFKPDKVAGGHVYPGITVGTRRERAESSVSFHLWIEGSRSARREADHDHRARRHGGSAFELCEHAVPTGVRASITESARAFVADAKADGTFDRLLEEHYGPYLRWQAGEKHPDTARRRAERRRSAQQDIDEATRGLAEGDRRSELAARVAELARIRGEPVEPEAEADPNVNKRVLALIQAHLTREVRDAPLSRAKNELAEEEYRLAALNARLASAQGKLQELDAEEAAIDHVREPSTSAEDEW